MKKTITILLIITITCTLLPMRVYAANETEEDTGLNYSPEAFNQLMESGEATVGEKSVKISEFFSLGTIVLGVLVAFLSVIPITINAILSLVTMSQQTPEEGENWELTTFTVGNVVLGKIDLFNIDFFSEGYDSNNSSEEGRTINEKIREATARWYAGIRVLAMGLSLLVLIYVGIRMALSTIASEKAKYREMVTDWAVSLVMLFVLHYGIIILIKLSTLIMDVIVPASGNIVEETEGTMIKELLLSMKLSANWSILLSFITYIIFTVYNIKFFLLYLKRIISTAFLIIISPLITVTYAIDRIGDKKAQALRAWLSEILVNIFIQPLHAILYLVFMFSASNIVKQAPILAILLFIGLSRGEKVVKQLFNMRGRTSINSMSAYMTIQGKKR